MRSLFSVILIFLFSVVFAQHNYKLVQNRLILPEPIVFEEHANDVFDTTDAMISYVAQYMLDNPNITKLRVESHVFTEKDANENTKLSLQRAAIVTYYLTLKGVDCSRLTASGFGNTKPIDDLADQYTNTRLEFHIQDLKNKSIPYTNVFDCKFYNPCDD
jgi:outer membrane protein OmpA-like peptidoglycan-associated protein